MSGMLIIKQLFCMHRWGDIKPEENFIRTGVMEERGDPISYYYWSCLIYCVKCGKKKKIQDGNWMGERGTARGLGYKLQALGVVLKS
jgi:hypothetical protein